MTGKKAPWKSHSLHQEALSVPLVLLKLLSLLPPPRAELGAFPVRDYHSADPRALLWSNSGAISTLAPENSSAFLTFNSYEY